MDLDLGKLFVGGISWDTDESRLKEYFSSYGEVVEAVIMRDRATGRARGFGFIVFADPAVAARVVMEKHMIDGRTVEAKKAVPRDDKQVLIRNISSVQGSQGPGRTKKIFVGGLASSVTERDFKKYFDQFGTITDVVVMYDHNTQRPRGFGFITFDSEEAVDRALHTTFHELNGKMVEVKRAVPKELSPGPNRSPLMGYDYGFSRANSFLDSFAQGYNLSPIGGYGVRMDSRYSPFSRTGFSPLGSIGFGVGVNLDAGASLNFGGSSNLGSNIGYGRLLSPYYGANSNRYSTPIGYGGVNVHSDSFMSAPARNAWGSGGLNSSVNTSRSNADLAAGSGSFGVFGNSGLNWGPSPMSPQGGGAASGYSSGPVGYGSRESNYGSRGAEFGGNSGRSFAPASSFAASSGNSDGYFYGSDSVYGDPTWHSASSELTGSSSFGYGPGNASEVTAKSSEGYVGHYGTPNRQENRGIAA